MQLDLSLQQVAQIYTVDHPLYTEKHHFYADALLAQLQEF
jgi:hypothetical protein